MYNNNSTGNNQDQPTRGDKKSYTCECGTTLLKSGKAKHERSKKHKAYMESIEQQTKTKSNKEQLSKEFNCDPSCQCEEEHEFMFHEGKQDKFYNFQEFSCLACKFFVFRFL